MGALELSLDERVSRQLIDLYHDQLQSACDGTERARLLTLLAEEQTRLKDLTSGSAQQATIPVRHITSVGNPNHGSTTVRTEATSKWSDNASSNRRSQGSPCPYLPSPLRRRESPGRAAFGRGSFSPWSSARQGRLQAHRECDPAPACAKARMIRPGGEPA